MLKYQIDTLDGLEDTVKPFYVEKDGKFVLQVDGVVSQSRADDLARQLQDAKNEAIDNRKKVKPYETLGTVDEIQARLAKAAKGQNPEHEQIIATLKAQHEAETTNLRGELTKVRRSGVIEQLKTHLAKADVMPEGLDMLAAFASQRMKFEDDGTVKFSTSDGATMLGSAKDASATISDFAKALAKEHPMLVKDAGTGGVGTTPGSKGGTPGKKTMARSEFDALSHAARAEFSTSGGTVV